MTVSYKNQTPIFQNSEFFLQAKGGFASPYQSFFLGNFPVKETLIDLYLLKYNNDSYNAVAVFGKKGGEYSSGFFQLVNDVSSNNKSSHFYAIYERAIEEKLIVLKKAIVGYSESRAEELETEYFESEFLKNKPSEISFYKELEAKHLNDEDYDLEVAAFEQKIKAYKMDWLKKHGSVPENPYNMRFMIFKSVEEAQALSEKGNCLFEEMEYIDDKHLNTIASEKRFDMKVLLS